MMEAYTRIEAKIISDDKLTMILKQDKINQIEVTL